MFFFTYDKGLGVGGWGVVMFFPKKGRIPDPEDYPSKPFQDNAPFLYPLKI